VGHDVAGRGAAFGFLVKHGADEVHGLVGEVAEDFEGFEVEIAFPDVDFSHIAISTIKGVGAFG